MDVVQGTVVNVTGSFRDPDTGAFYDPPDVTLVVVDPAGSRAVQSYSGSQVTKLSTGRYRGTFDTTPLPQVWNWEFGSTGSKAVRKKGFVNAKPKL